MALQKYCLTWKNFHGCLMKSFKELYDDDKLCDVTLCGEGYQITAHKVILSASSPYFQSAFENNPCQHPIVILKDVSREDLQALIHFIYEGAVDVSQSQLPSLIKTAELLQIKGLSGHESKSHSLKGKRKYEDTNYNGLSPDVLNKKAKEVFAGESKLSEHPSNAGSFDSDPSQDYGCEEVEIADNEDTKPSIEYDYCQLKDDSEILFIAPNDPPDFSSPSNPCLRSAEPVSCPQCNKFLKNEPCLRKHIRFIHSGPVVCHSCGKWFKNKGLFVEHSRLVCIPEGKRKVVPVNQAITP